MNMHDSCCGDSKEEDATTNTSTSCAKLGRDEVQSGQGHGVLRTRRRKTLQRVYQCLSLRYSVFIYSMSRMVILLMLK